MSFGPIGDSLLMLAFFDDILNLAPETSITVLTSTNEAIIRDLCKSYRNIQVSRIPDSSIKIIPFLIRILGKKWFLLVPGTARKYSFQISLFFLFMSALPWNLTIGYGDVRKHKGWLPFRVGLHFNHSISVLDNYRRMSLPILHDQSIFTRVAQVKLESQWPSDFAFKKRSYITIHLFGTRSRLSFPPERWKLILLHIRLQYPQYGLVFTGGKKDLDLIRSVTDGLSDITYVIDRPILEVAGIVENSVAYLGVDTGITHLASMLHVPSVVIGNNSNPMWMPHYNPNGTILMNLSRCKCTGDLNGDCRVFENGQGYLMCVYDISKEEVYKNLAEKISQGKNMKSL